MASFDPDAPDRDSADYETYLSDKIEEEERRLKSLQEKCRITSLEEQLASLRLESAKLEKKSFSAQPGESEAGSHIADTGV